MKVIYNNIIPFKGFKAINLFGIIFARKDAGFVDEDTIDHERVHSWQMCEVMAFWSAVILPICDMTNNFWWMLTIPVSYYAMYMLLWVLAGFKYSNIAFEAEAYDIAGKYSTYLDRAPFLWITYLFKR